MQTPWYLVGAVALIVGAAVWYLKNYIAEQAKNLATREHVEEITRKVESVKAEYQKEMEAVKAEYAKQNVYLQSHLSLSNQAEAAWEELKREALVEFYEECAILTHQKLRISNLFGFGFDKSSALNYNQQMRESFAKIATGYFRVCQYEQAGNHIWNAATDIMKAASELETCFGESYPTLANAYIRLAKVRENIETCSSEDRSNAMNQFHEAHREYSEKMKPCIKIWKSKFKGLVISVNKIGRV